MEISKEGQKLVVIKSFFHGKNFTPTPVTLEIKIFKEVLNPFWVHVLSTVCGGRSQLGLTDQYDLSKRQLKDLFLSEISSLNSMHACITRLMNLVPIRLAFKQ